MNLEAPSMAKRLTAAVLRNEVNSQFGGFGLAQIGSKGVFDGQRFAALVAERTIRVIIPALFREIFADNPACLEAAKRCEGAVVAQLPVRRER